MEESDNDTVVTAIINYFSNRVKIKLKIFSSFKIIKLFCKCQNCNLKFGKSEKLKLQNLDLNETIYQYSKLLRVFASLKFFI